jgi:Smg protein
VFDVLVYLYENYGALHACPDADSLSRKLTAAGFDDDEISEALAWLQGLESVTSQSVAVGPETEGSFRVYAKIETERLGADSIGFLSFLEHAGQLTPSQREIVIERALAIEDTPIPLHTIKVIVLMVLWSQQADIDVLLLEELLHDGSERDLH